MSERAWRPSVESVELLVSDVCAFSIRNHLFSVTNMQRRETCFTLHKRLGRIEGGPGYRITGNRRHTYAGWEWMHVAIDDHSRVAYVEMMPTDDAVSAAAFLRHAQSWFARQRVSIKRVLTDNGAGYLSREFGHVCNDLAIRRKRTRSHRPQTNGKAERLIQTLLRECVYRFSYDSSEQRRHAIERYIHFYDHQRAHSSLNDNAPITRLKLGTTS